jgi:poly(A) polymerase
MGLWKKQTGQAQGAEQFDIRGIVHEFKTSICAYQHWKEGMDIEVSHVKRKEIPLFVFPGEVRPSRSSKTTNKVSRTVPGHDISAGGQVGNCLSTVNCSDAPPAPYDGSYMKQPETYDGSYMKQPEPDSSGGYQLPVSTSVFASSSLNKEALNGHVNFQTDSAQHERPGHNQGRTSDPVKNAVCNVVNQPNSMVPNSTNDWQAKEFGSFYRSPQREFSDGAANNLLNLSSAIPAAPDELTSYQGDNNLKDANGDQRQLSDSCSGKSQGQTSTLSSHGNNHLKRKANEELEVLFFVLC